MESREQLTRGGVGEGGEREGEAVIDCTACVLLATGGEGDVRRMEGRVRPAGSS